MKIGWWLLAVMGPIGYVLPMAIPLLIGNYLIDPWLATQGLPGWALVIFWMLYTGITTGVTFALTIMAVQAVQNRQTPHRR